MNHITIEKMHGFYIIRRDGNPILIKFKKVEQDKEFEGYWLGHSATDKTVLLFSSSGDALWIFKGNESDIGVSKLLDKIVASENIVEGMSQIASLEFWTDPTIVQAIREKHQKLNLQRFVEALDSSKEKAARVEVIYELEKNCIEKFLRRTDLINKSNINRTNRIKTENTAKISANQKCGGK